MAEHGMATVAVSGCRDPPVIAYHFSLIEVIATLFVEGASVPVTSLVASIAFVLGIVAVFAG